jgi:hypothetical protein
MAISKSNRFEISAARSARFGSLAPAARLTLFRQLIGLPGSTIQPTSCSLTASASETRITRRPIASRL